MTSTSAPGTQLWLGLATLLALGLASLVFGFHQVGRFCMFATFALAVTNAIRKGMFPYVFGRHALVRATDPRGFWTAIVLNVALASVALWYFVNGLPL